MVLGEIQWGEVLNAFQGAVQTSVLVAGAAFAVIQIRAAKERRDYDAILAVFQEFHSSDGYARRHRVLYHDGPMNEQLSEHFYLECMQVADFFQRLGYLCRVGHLNRKHVLDMYGGTIVRLWAKLEPFVAMRRSIEGLKTYSVDFEALAVEAARQIGYEPIPGARWADLYGRGPSTRSDASETSSEKHAKPPV